MTHFLKSLRRSIKYKENWFYAFLNNTWFFLLYFSIPVPNRWVAAPFKVVYWIHVMVAECGRWLLKVFYYEPLFRSRCAVVGKRISLERLPYINGIGRLIIGNRVTLSGQLDVLFSNELTAIPELTIGDETYIGHACVIQMAERVTIGSHCYLAGGTLIYDLDGHSFDYLKRRELAPCDRESICPVTIEDDVWIGARAIILKGVKIGARSIIGAGSVVVREIPPDSIAAGVPAKVIGHVDPKKRQKRGSHDSQ